MTEAEVYAAWAFTTAGVVATGVSTGSVIPLIAYLVPMTVHLVYLVIKDEQSKR